MQTSWVRCLQSGEVTLPDVRPIEAYRAGHVPGAISVPLAELKLRLQELPKDRDIVAYCRGPYCVMEVEAVELLRKKGFEAQYMSQGVADFRARGWHVHSGNHGAPS